MSAMQRVKVRGTTRQLMLTKDSLGAVMPPLAAAMPHPLTRVTVNTSTTLMQLSTRLPEAEDQRKEQQNVGSKSRGYKVFLLTAKLTIFLRRTQNTCHEWCDNCIENNFGRANKQYGHYGRCSVSTLCSGYCLTSVPSSQMATADNILTNVKSVPKRSS